MPSGKATSVETWTNYIMMRRQGMSVYAAAKKVGLSYHACHDAENSKKPRNYITAEATLGDVVPAEVPQYDSLSEEAQAAFDNIEIFALRYFGIVLQPWQIEATERIMGLLDTEY